MLRERRSPPPPNLTRRWKRRASDSKDRGDTSVDVDGGRRRPEHSYTSRGESTHTTCDVGDLKADGFEKSPRQKPPRIRSSGALVEAHRKPTGASAPQQRRRQPGAGDAHRQHTRPLGHCRRGCQTRRACADGWTLSRERIERNQTWVISTQAQDRPSTRSALWA